jgi:hypothetical protein
VVRVRERPLVVFFVEVACPAVEISAALFRQAVFKSEFFQGRLRQGIDKSAGRKTAAAMSASRPSTVIAMLRQPHSA